jgi:hypothetical protein
MPFQLDTSIYGGGGREQRRPGLLGTLGGLVEIEAREEQIKAMQGEAKQRKMAMEKAQRELDKDAKLTTLYSTTPSPTLDQLIKTVGPETGTAMHVTNQTIRDNDLKYYATLEDRMGAFVGSLDAWPETSPTGGPTKASKWSEMFNELARTNMLPPGVDPNTPYSPEAAKGLKLRAQTIQQQRQNDIQERQTTVNELEEGRNQAAAPTIRAGQRAEADQKILDANMSKLRAAGNVDEYIPIMANMGSSATVGLPTPWDFMQDQRGSLAKLAKIGLTPAQQAQDADRDATNARLLASANAGAKTELTRAQRERAEWERREQLQKIDELVAADKLTPTQAVREQLRVHQDYLAATHQKADPAIADQIKSISLKELDDEKVRRSVGENGKAPENPMTDAELRRRQLPIYNRFRASHGLPPVSVLPKDWERETADGATPPPSGGGAPGPAPTPAPAAAPAAAAPPSLPPPTPPAPGRRTMWGGRPTPQGGAVVDRMRDRTGAVVGGAEAALSAVGGAVNRSGRQVLGLDTPPPAVPQRGSLGGLLNPASPALQMPQAKADPDVPKDVEVELSTAKPGKYTVEINGKDVTFKKDMTGRISRVR